MDGKTPMDLGASGSAWDIASEACNRTETAHDMVSNADSEVIENMTARRWHPSDDWANEFLEATLLDMRSMPSRAIRQEHYDRIRSVFYPRTSMPQHTYECFFLIYERMPQLLTNAGHWTMPAVPDAIDPNYVAPPSFLADRYVNYQGIVERYDTR